MQAHQNVVFLIWFYQKKKKKKEGSDLGYSLRSDKHRFSSNVFTLARGISVGHKTSEQLHSSLSTVLPEEESLYGREKTEKSSRSNEPHLFSVRLSISG